MAEEKETTPLSSLQSPPQEVSETELTPEMIAWRKQIRDQYQIQYNKLKEDLEKKLITENDQKIKMVVEELKKSQQPPTHDDIQKMLNAEYLEFEIKLRLNGTSEAQTVTLNELPASVERKVMRMLKEKLLPYAQNLAALTIDLAQGRGEDKVKAFFEALEPATDLIAEAVAIILSATLMKEITLEEVQDHVSLSRQTMILRAQMECNRLRDFFSQVSRIVVP